jgi:hypothetical protein
VTESRNPLQILSPHVISITAEPNAQIVTSAHEVILRTELLLNGALTESAAPFSFWLGALGQKLQVVQKVT